MSSRKITVKRWTEDDFLNAGESWEELLNDSHANDLFLSWHWMHGWWCTWGKQIATELYILAAYRDNDLVGIAPLYYSMPAILKGLLTVKRIELLGTQYRQGDFTRNEYLQFITKSGFQKTVNQQFINHLAADNNWDEMILADLIVGSDTWKTARASAQTHRHALRTDSCEETYVIDCTGSFASYISALGRNTRLKFYNRRKELEKHGAVVVRNARSEKLDETINHLNGFHEKRWSSLCFDDDSRAFIMNLSRRNLRNGLTCCSELLVDGKVVSVLYNLEAGRTIYNIQSGFIENFDRKIALGTLHLGYYIESLFEDNLIDAFDLLAGNGKNANYKSRLCSADTELETIQVVRSVLLKSMYSFKENVWDRLRGSSHE